MNSIPILTCQVPLHRAPAGGTYVAVVGVTADRRIAFVHSTEPGRGWELPGGLVEVGESALDAAGREFLEETGWRLENAFETARIDNVSEEGLHSHVFVVAGSVALESDGMTSDPDIAQRALMSSAPENCTFGREWVDTMIRPGIARMAAMENRRMWSQAAASYDDESVISTEEVHYGPLIPGESRLRLLPSLVGARVLDLGCGAGHNLAALRHAGAASGLGIDFSDEQARRARARLGSGAFEVTHADITAGTFIGAAPFDLVISVFSLAFVADPGAVLQAVGQSLRPGGTLVIATDHPCRVGVWSQQHLQISDWFAPRTRRRFWTAPHREPIPYVHHVHDLPTLVNAITLAGLMIEAVLEPRALPLTEIDAAPYRCAYFLGRHEELSRTPYTLVLKARRPQS